MATVADILLEKISLSEGKQNIYSEHSVRVSEYLNKMFVIMVLSELADDFNEYTSSTVFLAGLLHDIGKTEIPMEILSKPTKLSEDEWEQIKTHSARGKEILNHPDIKAMIKEYFPYAQIDVIQNVVYTHHCRVDGEGYPQTSEEMSPLSKLCAIADTYDAIREDRPYRKGVSHEEAINMLMSVAGTQLDEDMVRILYARDFQLS